MMHISSGNRYLFLTETWLHWVILIQKKIFTDTEGAVL